MIPLLRPRAEERRIVLVTGAPRSGTTVVGDVLAARRGSVSLYEPMNIQSGDKRFGVPFPIPGASGFDMDALGEFLDDLRGPRLSLRPGVFPHENGVAALGKRLIGSRTRASLRGALLRPWADTLIWKDPFALLCVPALVGLGLPVIVTYRPAAAIAASFKRLNWSFDVEAIHRRAVAGGLRAAPPRTGDGVGRETAAAVYLWRLCAEMCLTLGPGAMIVSTGNLAIAPGVAFDAIFAHAGLAVDARAAREIGARFAPRAAAAIPSGHPHSRKRDPRAVNDYWKDVLSPAERAFVAEETAELEPRIAPRLFRPVPARVA